MIFLFVFFTSPPLSCFTHGIRQTESLKSESHSFISSCRLNSIANAINIHYKCSIWTKYYIYLLFCSIHSTNEMFEHYDNIRELLTRNRQNHLKYVNNWTLQINRFVHFHAIDNNIMSFHLSIDMKLLFKNYNRLNKCRLINFWIK